MPYGKRNVAFFNMKKAQEENTATGEMVTVTRYLEDEDLESKVFEKDVFKAGETIEYEYEFMIHERQQDGEVTKGKITLKADGYSQEKELGENKILDADLKITTRYSKTEEVGFAADYMASMSYILTNLTNENLTNVRLQVNLPEGTSFDDDFKTDTEDYKFISCEGNVVTLEIKDIKPQEVKHILLYIYVKPIDIDKQSQNYIFSANATINDKTYYSNELLRTAKQTRKKIAVNLESNLDEPYLTEGKEVYLTTKIKNESDEDVNMQISYDIPHQLKAIEAYIMANGEKLDVVEINEDDDQVSASDYKLEVGKEIKFVVKVMLTGDVYETYDIENYTEVTLGQQTEKSNIVKFEISEDYVPEEPEKPENPGDWDDSSKYFGKIAGMVWLDENQDGRRNQEEMETISGVPVVLIDATTGEIAKNDNQKEIRTQTDELGEYSFGSLKPGKYIVAFVYDSNKYMVTSYKTEGISEKENSDVISKTILLNGQETVVAITNEMEVKDNQYKNIDAGFYERDVFDLSLKKTIRRVVVQTAKNTRVSEYEGQSLVKVEIAAKELANATVIVEYDIQVTNEGEVPGYAKEIIDYMPKDFKFNSEINKDWYMTTDGNLCNSSLQNTLINPGESKTITLSLVKTMNQNNTGTSLNMAEILKDTNDFNILDRDSVAGNKKDNEDDISSAELIVSVSTGVVTVIFICLIILVLLISVAVFVYTKREKRR